MHLSDILDLHLDPEGRNTFDYVKRTLSNFDHEDLIDYAFSIYEECTAKGTRSKDPFRFVADSRLAGFPHYCGSAYCRQDYIDQLITFAILYTSECWIPNPIAYPIYLQHKQNDEKIVRKHIFDAVYHLSRLAPLVDSGIIMLGEYLPIHTCEFCAAKAMQAHSGSIPEDSKGDGGLRVKILNELCMSSRSYVSDGLIHIEYDESHSEHSLIVQGSNSLAKSFSDGHILTFEEIFNNKLQHRTANFIANDIVNNNYLADQCGAESVISNPVDLAIINTFLDFNPSNQIDIPHRIPSIRDIKEAIKMREQEWHRISEFRIAVRDTAKNSEGSIIEAQEHINAELGKIDEILLRSQNSSRDSIFFSLSSAATMFASAGLISGISGIVTAAAAALGSGHIARQTIPALRESMKIPNTARDSRLFYGWRVSKALSGTK